MAKINADKKLIAEVLERGVEKVYPVKNELEKKLLTGKDLRIS